MADIAVVIPCFNSGRFLEDALGSVLRQSRRAAEVVVVDDGSTNIYTRQLLTSLEYPETRIVRTSNRGLSAARNHGIRLTTADYLVTLDADDRLHPEYLAKTAARLDANPALGFVSTAIRAFGEASWVWTPPACTVVNGLVRGAAHPASMVRRQVWQAVGGFDESPAFLKGGGDLDFWLSAMELGVHGEVIVEPLLEYRVRATSMRQDSLASGGQLRLTEAPFRKHRASIAAIGPHLLVEKDQCRKCDTPNRLGTMPAEPLPAGSLFSRTAPTNRLAFFGSVSAGPISVLLRRDWLPIASN